MDIKIERQTDMTVYIRMAMLMEAKFAKVPCIGLCSRIFFFFFFFLKKSNHMLNRKNTSTHECADVEVLTMTVQLLCFENILEMQNQVNEALNCFFNVIN